MDQSELVKYAVIFLVIAAILFVLWLIYRHNFKKITVQTVNLITGAPKTGKSLLCADVAVRTYKKSHRWWWLKTHIPLIKRKYYGLEEPLFYTNVIFSFKNWKNSLNVAGCIRKPHRLDKNIRTIDIDILRRAKRLVYKSVVYIQESSLTADQQEFKDQVLNCEQSLFNKLFGHETRGGWLFYDTQNLMDNHYAIKRCVSSYIWIQKSRNFLGLFRILYVRELANSESVVGVQNNMDDDVEFSGIRKYIVWRWVYKRYDRYYFSYLTDNLPVANEIFDYTEGQKHITSFSPLYRAAGEGKTEDELRRVQLDHDTKYQEMLYEKKQRIKKAQSEQKESK